MSPLGGRVRGARALSTQPVARRAGTGGATPILPASCVGSGGDSVFFAGLGARMELDGSVVESVFGHTTLLAADLAIAIQVRDSGAFPDPDTTNGNMLGVAALLVVGDYPSLVTSPTLTSDYGPGTPGDGWTLLHSDDFDDGTQYASFYVFRSPLPPAAIGAQYGALTFDAGGAPGADLSILAVTQGLGQYVTDAGVRLATGSGTTTAPASLLTAGPSPAKPCNGSIGFSVALGSGITFIHDDTGNAFGSRSNAGATAAIAMSGAQHVANGREMLARADTATVMRSCLMEIVAL